MSTVIKKPKLLICDSDSFIFRASYHHRDLQNIIGIGLAKKKMDREIENLLEKIRPDYYILFHGEPGSRCFRYELATIRPYKEARINRSDLWSEYFKVPLKSHLKNRWGSMAMSKIEADDACSIALEQYKDDYEIVMFYEDHDFNQLANCINAPVRGYNPGKKHYTNMTVEESRYEWWLQCITGCNGDSVPGIPGIGQDSGTKKTSKGHKILATRTGDTNEEYFQCVREAYINKYGPLYLPFLLENYVLLQMLQKPMFDYPKNIVLQKYVKVEETVKHTQMLDL